MRKFGERIGEVVRLSVAIVASAFAFSASAEYLWWTVDFTDDWGNEGELTENPAGEGATGFEINLMINLDGEKDCLVGGITISDDMTQFADGNTTMEIDISGMDTDSLSFYVEMVNAADPTSHKYYISRNFSYSDLVAAGNIADDIMSFDAPWNPAVDGAWEVPEPSGGILVLWGLGLLMLRRKKLTADDHQEERRW